MSAVAHAVLSLLVGAATPEGLAPNVPAPSVPAPRPVPEYAPLRPAPKPIAVATVGFGALAIACGASITAIGVQSRRIAGDGRTEGEVHARDTGARHLLAVGIPLAAAGVGLLVGGVVWVVRSRRGPSRARSHGE